MLSGTRAGGVFPRRPTNRSRNCPSLHQRRSKPAPRVGKRRISATSTKSPDNSCGFARGIAWRRGGPMRDDDQTPDEGVPAALREILDWDFRHDAMARLIMDEFALTQTRVRELSRQLAFIRVQYGEEHVIPFGKHKDRLLEEILIDDPSYLDWVVAQDWFRTEFPALHEVIINFDAE